MELTTKQLQNLKLEISMLRDWLSDHDCDVDHKAFEDATYKVLRAAFPSGRVPNIPLGMLAYDVAAAVANLHIPERVYRSAVRYNLPGAKLLERS